MKRKSLLKKLAVLGGVGLVVGAFVLVAMLGGNRTLHQVALANIAEARHFMKHAQSDNLRVQFFSGIREANYAMDGVAGQTVEFALLNVEPRNISHIDDQELRGEIKINGETKEVTLERNQFGRNFAVDLGKAVAPDAEIIFTLLAENQNPVIFNLVNSMNAEAITWDKALEIAVDSLKEPLSNAQGFETYVKIITDRESIAAFWFVQFVTVDGKTHFAVIDTTGDVITVNA